MPKFKGWDINKNDAPPNIQWTILYHFIHHVVVVVAVVAVLAVVGGVGVGVGDRVGVVLLLLALALVLVVVIVLYIIFWCVNFTIGWHINQQLMYIIISIICSRDIQSFQDQPFLFKCLKSQTNKSSKNGSGSKLWSPRHPRIAG
jgi:preprotein translocase subunit SecE